MEPLLIAGATVLLLVGIAIAVAGTVAPSLSDFLDRPLCWLVGHKPERYLFPSVHNGHPAQVWRCARGHDPVIYVGSEAPRH